MRATIDWSYELLEAQDQRCSCGSPCSRAAARSRPRRRVRGRPRRRRRARVPDRQRAIRVEGTDEAPRFAMLEPIREYAVERLKESGGGRAAAAPRRLLPGTRGGSGAEPTREPRGLARPAGARARQLPSRPRPARGVRRQRDCSAVGSRTVAVLVPGPPGGRSPATGERPPHGRTSDGGPSQGSQRSRRDGGQHRDTEAAKLRAEEALALHRKLGDAWGAAYSVFMLGAAEDDARGHSSSTKRASASSVSSATSTPLCWRPATSRRTTPTSATANALERCTRTTSSEHGKRTTSASKRARSVPWRRSRSTRAESRTPPRC